MGAHFCSQCGEKLTADDIALYRKLVFRDAKEYTCMCCLAVQMGVEKKKLDNIVNYYHRTGICSLFPVYD